MERSQTSQRDESKF